MENTTADDRRTAEKPTDERPNLNYGLAAEVWAADDPADALARWREQTGEGGRE